MDFMDRLNAQWGTDVILHLFEFSSAESCQRFATDLSFLRMDGPNIIYPKNMEVQAIRNPNGVVVLQIGGQLSVSQNYEIRAKAIEHAPQKLESMAMGSRQMQNLNSAIEKLKSEGKLTDLQPAAREPDAAPEAPPPIGAELNAPIAHFNLKRYGNRVEAVAWARDSNWALAAVASTVVLLDVRSGKVVRRFREHSSTLRCLAFSPDGRLAASAGGDTAVLGLFNRGSEIRLWETASGKEVQRLEAHRKPVTSLVFTHDGKSLLSGSADGTVRLWAAGSGEEIESFSGGTCLALSPDGRRVLGGGSGRAVQFLELETGDVLWSGPGGHRADAIKGVSISADGKRGFSGGGALLCRWSLKTGKPTYSRDMAVVRCVAFAPGGDWAVTAGGDPSAQPNHFLPARDIDGEETTVYGVCNADVIVWELPKGIIRKQLHAHQAAVHALAWSPDGSRVLSGDAEGIVTVWG